MRKNTSENTSDKNTCEQNNINKSEQQNGSKTGQENTSEKQVRKTIRDKPEQQKGENTS
jgi:hypothetical protein